MTLSKRIFDICLSLTLILFLSPFILFLIIWLFFKQGKPIFYIAERMQSPEKAFGLWKFRTMTVVNQDSGVSGGDKTDRITQAGVILRAKRFDEFPQLWNILKGDISFVGPRPPLRRYVETNPEVYAKVLRSRPGVTGLASIVYHKHEEMLLSRCSTPEETHDVYSRICVPAKAKLDLIYQENRSFCFDIRLILSTARGVLRRPR